MKKKVFIIEVTRIRLRGDNSKKYVLGTLEALKKYFSYTLEVGKSWENEPGARKVNTDPKGGKSLVKSLDASASNAGMHYQSEYFSLVEEKTIDFSSPSVSLRIDETLSWNDPLSVDEFLSKGRN